MCFLSEIYNDCKFKIMYKSGVNYENCKYKKKNFSSFSSLIIIETG